MNSDDQGRLEIGDETTGGIAIPESKMFKDDHSKVEASNFGDNAGFEAGVAGEDKRKDIRRGEAACAFLFYAVMFMQIILFVVVFAGQNTKLREADSRECPDGYSFRHGMLCMSDSLRQDRRKCLADEWAKGKDRRLEHIDSISANMSFDHYLRKLASEEEPASPKDRMMRRLAAKRLVGERIPQDLWQFLEEFAEVPIIIFGGTFVVASWWLVLMKYVTGPVIWGTLMFDILVLIFASIWCLVEFKEFNYILFALAIGFMTGICCYYRHIKVAIVVMHKAMEGLSHNKRLFTVSFGLTILWVGFFALWIASLIGIDMAKSIGVDGDCSPGVPGCNCAIVNKYPSGLRVFWIIAYYWSTCFFNNAKLVVITAELGEWFFKGEGGYDKTIWRQATVWAFHPLRSGGANAICSGIMGASQYLMNYFSSKARLIAGLLNPIEWIPLCLAFALKQVVHTYTKYGLIAQVYSAQPFCVSAQKAFLLLRGKLGEAFIADNVGKRVLGWCTYLLSLGVAMATLTWGNALQGVDEANRIFHDVSHLIFVMLLLAWIVSFPFASVVFICTVESLLPQDVEPTSRAMLNSILVAIFMGCITNFLLRTMSHVVVSAMDVIFFCFAVEQELDQKQVRFKDLYAAIKMTVTPGAVHNEGVVVGHPAQTIPIQVPEGAGPGTIFSIQGPDGLIEVQVPPSLQPGQFFYVGLPSAAEAPELFATAQVVGAPLMQKEVVGVPQPPAQVLSARKAAEQEQLRKVQKEKEESAWMQQILEAEEIDDPEEKKQSGSNGNDRAFVIRDAYEDQLCRECTIGSMGSRTRINGERKVPRPSCMLGDKCTARDGAQHAAALAHPGDWDYREVAEVAGLSNQGISSFQSSPLGSTLTGSLYSRSAPRFQNLPMGPTLSSAPAASPQECEPGYEDEDALEREITLEGGHSSL